MLPARRFIAPECVQTTMRQPVRFPRPPIQFLKTKKMVTFAVDPCKSASTHRSYIRIDRCISDVKPLDLVERNLVLDPVVGPKRT